MSDMEERLIDLSRTDFSPPPDCEEKTYEVYDIVQGITYEEFFTKYLWTNTPCLVESISTEWPAQKLWVVNGKPNFEHFKTRYGHGEAPVTNCHMKYFNSHSCQKNSIGNFVRYWEEFSGNNYPRNSRLLYLKDWHFVRDFPEDIVYSVPKIFASDWLNEYYTSNTELNDDFKFVYLGPRGTWTAFHSDVFSSFSWSVNICGRKKWVFYPPGAEVAAKDKYGTLAHDLGAKELQDPVLYPNLLKGPKPLTVIQEVGDAVFVPSNWYHQVWNLEDTISLNHNWVNACNINRMWKAIRDHNKLVEKEISDCRGMPEWEDQCQFILKTSFGLNLMEFCKFVLFIGRQRVKHLKENTPLQDPSGWLFGVNHIKFDLLMLLPVLEDVTKLDLTCLQSHKEEILKLNDEIKAQGVICN